MELNDTITMTNVNGGVGRNSLNHKAHYVGKDNCTTDIIACIFRNESVFIRSQKNLVVRRGHNVLDYFH